MVTGGGGLAAEGGQDRGIERRGQVRGPKGDGARLSGHQGAGRAVGAVAEPPGGGRDLAPRLGRGPHAGLAVQDIGDQGLGDPETGGDLFLGGRHGSSCPDYSYDVIRIILPFGGIVKEGGSRGCHDRACATGPGVR